MNTFINDRVRILNVEVLSDNWYILKKTTFEFQRADGSWQLLSRETYDRGNGAVILPFNRQQKTVLLTRQFRYPAFVNDHSGMLIEACAGLLDARDPVSAIQAEAEEELGYRLSSVHKIFEAFMSPGSVTERLYFFIAEYDSAAKVSEGGGQIAEGEDVGVLELSFSDALRMVASGEIMDAKTIMLLQYAQLHSLF
ncbi:MAG TPA: NUDIX domain-containing protein [Aggregatilineales bacterium]|nr:NUDIX domain-containing protein [Aggregatilineales bacterium]